MRVQKSKVYSEENYLEEYKMLREEAQDCFRRQQEWSVFSITTVITLVSLALNIKDAAPEMFLLPYIVLLIAAVKVHNLREGILRITGYLKSEMESPVGFMWETHLNGFRNIIEHRMGELGKLISVIQTQEFTILGIACFVLYFMDIRKNLIVFDPPYIQIRYAIGITFSVVFIIFLFLISKNYFTLRSSEINDNVEMWKKATK